MIPIEIDTNGYTHLPCRTAGSITPKTGPAMKPATSRSRMEGRLYCHASHCAPTPRIRMRATPKRNVTRARL
jgi:hypothetical protein